MSFLKTNIDYITMLAINQLTVRLVYTASKLKF